MDGLDGMQLVDQLARLQIDIPIVAMTGYGTRDTFKELLQLGCKACIEKPFEAADLLQQITLAFAQSDND